MEEFLAVIPANSPYDIRMFKVIQDYTERFSSIEDLLDADDRGEYIKPMYPDETHTEESAKFAYTLHGRVSVFITERFFF